MDKQILLQFGLRMMYYNEKGTGRSVGTVVRKRDLSLYDYLLMLWPNKRFYYLPTLQNLNSDFRSIDRFLHREQVI
jgi:hypothetical protein